MSIFFFLWVNSFSAKLCLSLCQLYFSLCVEYVSLFVSTAFLFLSRLYFSRCVNCISLFGSTVFLSLCQLTSLSVSTYFSLCVNLFLSLCQLYFSNHLSSPPPAGALFGQLRWYQRYWVADGDYGCGCYPKCMSNVSQLQGPLFPQIYAWTLLKYSIWMHAWITMSNIIVKLCAVMQKYSGFCSSVEYLIMYKPNYMYFLIEFWKLKYGWDTKDLVWPRDQICRASDAPFEKSQVTKFYPENILSTNLENLSLNGYTRDMWISQVLTHLG